MFYFLKIFIAKHLILTDDHYASFSEKWKPTLNSLNFHSSTTKYRINIHLYLHLYFFTKGRYSSTCNSTSQMSLLHSLLSCAYRSSSALKSKEKTFTKLVFLLSHWLFDFPFTIKHLKRYTYNFCHYFLTSHSCLKLTVIWLLPLPLSWSYPVNVICEILKNPFTSAWSSSYWIYLWY